MEDEAGKQYGHGTPCSLCHNTNTIYISCIDWKAEWITRNGKELHLCLDCKWVFDENGEGQTI